MKVRNVMQCTVEPLVTDTPCSGHISIADIIPGPGLKLVHYFKTGNLSTLDNVMVPECNREKILS